MWDNPRLLNTAAGALVGIALLLFAVAAGVALLRSPFFPVTEVALAHPLGNTTREEIEAALRPHLARNFFSLAPTEVRAALEDLPWVRRASVRRLWPDRLEIAVEEHVAFARWGAGALLSREAIPFRAVTQASLPALAGPAGTEREVMERYASFARTVAALGALERLTLTERRAWHLTLDTGLEIMLGRDAPAAEARLRRFVEVYPNVAGRVARRVPYVDLRYPSGFALRVPEGRGDG